MRKTPFIILLLLMLLPGCPGQPPQGNETPQGNVSMIISPITIAEEKETVVTGESIIIVANNTTLNKTVPDYKFEPNKTIFVFFINTSYIKDWSENATNERHGESILIKKGDADILIDSGPEQASTELVNFLKQKGVDDIELLVSTHPRPENYGGMDAILDNFEVEQFMWNGDSGSDPIYEALVNRAKGETRRTIEASYLAQESINGINFLALNPRNGSERFFTIDNDGIVFRITDRNFCLMTTGDIAYGAQARIADGADFDPGCAVLQVPNYGLGAGTSQIDILLLKVAPKAAIITGSYFDPDRERYSIEEKLTLKGIPYYETFMSNKSRNITRVIRITSDGYNYTIAAQ